jgi:serine/threonine-protein kinase
MSDGHSRSKSASLVGVAMGSYRILDELSAGGMGTVYRAEHSLLGRPAAVKLLHRQFTEDPELVQRFFNEAKAATAINHPGIVEVFDFGYSQDNRAYLVMEFLEGDTLGRRLQLRGRLKEAEAVPIARGIASALLAAHGKGIVHRDLKPENVFLVRDPDIPGGERPKVLDFGIAKLAYASEGADTRHTSTGKILGTPTYMSPEQARSTGDVDRRADLYSLGCILYELLVGKPPFVAPSANEQIALQLFGEVEPPSKRGIAISPELEAIVLKLLEKEPADRFQNCAELMRALDALSAPRPRAEAAEPTEPVAVPRRRRLHWFVIVLVVLALISAGVAAYVVIKYRQSQEAPPAPTFDPYS